MLPYFDFTPAACPQKALIAFAVLFGVFRGLFDVTLLSRYSETPIVRSPSNLRKQ